MITGEHAIIRTAEPDDAPVLYGFYRGEKPRCCLLDMRRELFAPTLDEVREALAQKEMGRALFYVVEDKAGGVRGFGSLRGLNLDVSYTELFMMFVEDADLETPIASELFDFLSRQAFQQCRLNKVMSHTLETETALRDFLVRHGFIRDGVQREVVFTRGRWHDIETFTLFRSATLYAPKPGRLETVSCP